MKRRLIASAVAAGLTGLAALPAAASATTLAAPTSLTFAEQQVGTTSDPKVVTVFVQCTADNGMGMCLNDDTFTPNPQFTGLNFTDFTQTNDCAPSKSNSGIAFGVCQFQVSFKPTPFNPIAMGTRTATLSLGSSQDGGPSTISLTGAAVAAPSTGGSTTGVGNGSGGGAGTTTAKKCKKKKKKHSASSAKKKCKKKK